MNMDKIFETLSLTTSCHSPFSKEYLELESQLLHILQNSSLAEGGDGEIDFWNFGSLVIPHRRMGAITSLELFGLDELIIFLFYKINQSRYKSVSDIGANIGLHSVILSKCGYDVQSYEPDANHIEVINQHAKLNNISNIHINQAAVSDHNGTVEFTRVLGNTTGSHISGSKENPYGELEKFTVDTIALPDIMKNSDLIKMDIEGHEAQAILATAPEDWDNVDMMLAVGTVENASLIFNHITKLGLTMFSQKNGWSQGSALEDLPTSYKEGSLFLTKKVSMQWL